MTRKPSGDALRARVKGKRRGYLAEFIEQRAFIVDYLQRGHTLPSIFEYLVEAGAISFSIHTLRRYVFKYLSEAERTPQLTQAPSHTEPAAPRQPISGTQPPTATTGLNRPKTTPSEPNSAPAPQTKPPPKPPPRAPHQTNPLLEKRERPPSNWQPSGRAKHLY